MRAAPFQINSLETGMKLLTTAIDVQDTTLAKRCVEYLDRELRRENVVVIYTFLHRCQMPEADPNSLEPSAPPLIEDANLKGKNWVRTLVEDLRHNCLLLIDAHADYVLKQKDLVNLSYVDMYDIVSRDTLRVTSEVLVFNVVHRWGVLECKRMTLKEYHLPEVLRQLRYAPRYGLMHRKEFRAKMREIMEEKDWRHIKFYLEEKAKGRPVNELPHKLSQRRVSAAQQPRSLSGVSRARVARDEFPQESRRSDTKCDRFVINMLTCWTAVFD